MSELKLDPYGHRKLAPERAALPDSAAKVAVAVVYYEALGSREAYWLSPATDHAPVHELWFEWDELPGRFSCCGRLEAGEPVTAVDAAEILLGGLWHVRYAPAISLSRFEEAGLLSDEVLKDLHAGYVERLKPPKAPEGEPLVHGELFYKDGTLKYRGETCGGLPHGRGIGYWENGAVWCEGEFRDGGPHGYCVMHREDGNPLYEGCLAKGVPCGQGREYHKNGKLWFDGVFGETRSIYQGYGCRNWVRGRLYDNQGKLVHDGEFRFNGKHSFPVKPTSAP